MSQTYTDDVYSGGHNAATDLQNMENNFAALKSSFSGTTAPSSPVEGQMWRDTTDDLLKEYNGSGWLGLMHGDSAQKIWVYRNAALTGWVVDSSVTDKVLTLKGGTTYTAGAATAGSWTISGMAHTHTVGTHVHQMYNHNSSNNVDDQHYNSSGAATDCASTDGADEKLENYYGWPPSVGGTVKANASVMSIDLYTKTGGTANTGSGGSSDGTWRPAAAVGTLQYLDV